MAYHIGPYFMNRGSQNLMDVRIAIYEIDAILGLRRAIYFIKRGVGLISKRKRIRTSEY